MTTAQQRRLARALAAVHRLGHAAQAHAQLARPRRAQRRAVYQAIIAYKREHGGDSPTLDELGAATGLRSKSTVSYHLRRLEDDGLIRRSRGKNGIDVVGGSWVMSADMVDFGGEA